MNYLVAVALWLAISMPVFAQTRWEIEYKHGNRILVGDDDTMQQARTPCPDGKVEAGGMATTGMIFEHGCYTPAEKRELDMAFSKSMCEETSSSGGTWGEGWEYRDLHYFVDGRCVETKSFDYRTRRGRVIPVSEETYMRGTCTKEWIDYNQVYPKPDWKECQK